MTSITGTPTALGTSQVTVTVKDTATPVATATETFTLTVAAAPPPSTNPSGESPPAKGSVDPVTGYTYGLVDDFTGSSLNGAVWQDFYTGSNPAGNSPFEASNGSVGNSMVTIVAGPNAPGGNGGTGFNTNNFGYFSAGHFKVRARCSLGQGFTMCFGMIGQTISPWPPEIDFYEDAGYNGGGDTDTERQATQATVHWGSGNNTVAADERGIDATAWHTWELIYNGNESGSLIQYLCDGVQWGSNQGGSIGYGNSANNLGQPQVMFMQLEDGDGAPGPTGNVKLVTMEVDWVAIEYPSSAFTAG